MFRKTVYFYVCLFISTIWLVLPAKSFASQQNVIITEVASSNGHGFRDEDGDLHDWIELYNTGPADVSLGDFQLTGRDADWTFPKTVIGPGEYLVVFASGKNRLGPQLHTNFRISDKGEKLTLTDPTGRTVSSLETGFIPAGYSRAFNGLHYLLSSEPTPSDENAFICTECTVAMRGSYVDTQTDEVLITLTNFGDGIIDLEGYTLNNGSQDWEFSPRDVLPGEALSIGINRNINADIVTDIIASEHSPVLRLVSSDGVIIDQIVLTRVENELDPAIEPAVSDQKQMIIAVVPPSESTVVPLSSHVADIVINEIVSAGDPDWIELKNNSAGSLDVSGYFLSDEFTDPGKYEIPAGSVIPAGGYIVFEAFEISDFGESIIFSDPALVELEEVDLPELVAGTSYARIPDGEGEFKIVNSITRGSMNIDNTQDRPIDLVINEVMADNISFNADEDGDYEDWIEIKNRGDVPVDMDGFVLADTGEFWTFPAVTIGAGEYLLVWASDKDRAGSELHTNFKIAKQGEVITLTDGQGEVIDLVNTGHMLVNRTQGRFPDGLLLSFEDLYPPTPGAPNMLEDDPGGAVYLRINEVMADNNAFMIDQDGDFGGWIEIKNIGDFDVNLNGFVLSDDTASWTFADEDLKVGERTLVWASGKDRTGVQNHASFTLEPAGETLTLEDPSDTLLDTVNYGAMNTDTTRGSLPDGDQDYENLNPPTPWMNNRKAGADEIDLAARMISPVRGEFLASTQITFSWTPVVGAQQYFLGIATAEELLSTPPYGDIFAANIGLRTSQLVAGIELTDRLVFARLWTLVGGEWQYIDYAWQTADISEKSELTSPVPGDVIDTSQVVFQWTRGKNVTGNYIGVGTTFASVSTYPWGDIYARNVSGIRQIVVDGVPLAGGEVFVRLWSEINGEWVFNDYRFDTAHAAGPVLLDPSPGEVIGTETYGFKWTDAANVTEYFLGVGTSSSAVAAAPWGDIYAGSLGRAQFVNVNGIPLNGEPIFVRLWYKSSGVWLYDEYSFDTENRTVPSLTDPAPGTALTDAETLFSWTPVIGAQSYFLGVGTTQSSVENAPWGNIFARSTGLSTNATVPGIPINGDPVYVRLWYRVDSEWDFVDHVFDTSPTFPEMISPVPGSSFTSSSQDFDWTAGSNVQGYYLGVGTSASSVSSAPWGDIFAGSTGSATQQTVTGIPVGTVHVRLWYKIENLWYFTDYTFERN